MIQIVVCWEDEYHDKLDRGLRRALRRRAPEGPSVALFPDGVRGYGNFEPYVRSDWRNARLEGIAKSRGPIDYLICVADADRATECCATIPEAPKGDGTSSGWVSHANDAWTEKLRAAAPLEPSRIFGVFLRWSQESLLIAAHDVPGAMQKLGCKQLDLLQAHLRACRPSPLDTPDHLFADRFRKAGKCLDDMLKAARAQATKKGSVPQRDALGIAIDKGIDRLCARVPDLAALADRITALAA
jgi:hypothetical protein